MNREALKQYARDTIIGQAPELGVRAAENIINSGPMQRWFDDIEQKRPRGIVARFRRWRGRSGLDADELRELEDMVRGLVKRSR